MIILLVLRQILHSTRRYLESRYWSASSSRDDHQVEPIHPVGSTINAGPFCQAQVRKKNKPFSANDSAWKSQLKPKVVSWLTWVMFFFGVHCAHCAHYPIYMAAPNGSWAAACGSHHAIPTTLACHQAAFPAMLATYSAPATSVWLMRLFIQTQTLWEELVNVYVNVIVDCRYSACKNMNMHKYVCICSCRLHGNAFTCCTCTYVYAIASMCLGLWNHTYTILYRRGVVLEARIQKYLIAK